MRRPPGREENMTERQVATANDTLNAFVGGRQKSWMTAASATVRPSPRVAARAPIQQSMNSSSVLPSPAPSDEPSPVTSILQVSPDPEQQVRSNPEVVATQVPQSTNVSSPVQVHIDAVNAQTETHNGSPTHANNEGSREPVGPRIGTWVIPPQRQGYMAQPQAQNSSSTAPINNTPNLRNRVYIIDTHVESIGGGNAISSSLDLPRFKLLKDACIQEDFFYVALHQIFCLWTFAPNSIQGKIPNCDNDTVVAHGLLILGQLIKENESLDPVNLKWFSYFPGNFADFAVRSKPYGEAIGKVGVFLSKLTSDWTRYNIECGQRGYPPLMDELVNRLSLTSPILQQVVFTAARRNLGFKDDNFGNRAEALFHRDMAGHRALALRMSTDRPPTQNEIQERNMALINRYLKTQRQRTSSASNSPMAINTSGHNSTGRPQAANGHTSQAPSPSTTTFDIGGRLVNSPNLTSSGHSSPQLQQMNYNRNPSNASSPQLQQTNYSGNPSNASSPQQQMYFSRNPSNISSPQQHMNFNRNPSTVQSPLVPQTPQAQGQFVQSPVFPPIQTLRSNVASGSHPTQQNAAAHQSIQMYAQNGQSPVFWHHLTRAQQEQVNRTTVARQQHSNQQHYINQQQNMTQPILSQYQQAWNQLQNQPQAPPVGYYPGSPSNAGNVLNQLPTSRPPSSSNHTQLNMQFPFIPRLGSSFLPQAYIPDETALHQAHLKSPRLLPTDIAMSSSNPNSLRCYQVVRNLAVGPSVLSMPSSLSKLSFRVSDSSISKLPQVVDDFTRKFTVGTLQYRLRCIQLKTAKPPTEAEWVVAETKWPRALFMEINGPKNQLELRRKAYYGKDQPVDLTNYVRANGSEQPNVLLVSCSRLMNDPLELPYGIGVEVIEILQHDHIIRKCLESQTIPPEETLNKIKASLAGPSNNDDDFAIVASDITIDLADPFMAKIFDIPAKGKDCLHRECFDLETFLNTRGSKPNTTDQPSMIDVWKCPRCSLDARPQNLVIDGFLVNVRKQLVEQGMLHYKAITVAPDGEWRPKPERQPSLKRKSIKADAAGFRDVDDYSDDEGITPMMKKVRMESPDVSRGGRQGNENTTPDVIVLDDSD